MIFSLSPATTQLSTQVTMTQRVLPRGQPSLHLCELKTTHDKLAELMSRLGSCPQILGIYESQVTPLFRAIETLGCCCRIRPSARQKPLSATFELTDFDWVSPTDPIYLHTATNILTSSTAAARGSSARGPSSQPDDAESAKNPLRGLLPAPLGVGYLYHSHADNDQRAFFGLYLPRTHTLTLFVVNPYIRAQLPNAKALMLEHLGGAMNPLPAVDVNIVATMQRAHKDLNRLLATSAKDTVLVVQSSATLTGELTALQDIPNLPMPGNAHDSQYPALGWLPFTTRLFASRLLSVPGWLLDLLSFSRYGSVPLGNLTPPDHSSLSLPLLLSDYVYARNLHHATPAHVLWISTGRTPDLGTGLSGDMAITGSGTGLMQPSAADFVASSPDGHDPWRNPEISQTGTFKSVSIDIDITHLGVDALLESVHLTEMGDTEFVEDQQTSGAFLTDFAATENPDEGGAGPAGAEAGGAAGAQPSAKKESPTSQIPLGAAFARTPLQGSCAPALRQLRQMLAKWFADTELGIKTQAQLSAQQLEVPTESAAQLNLAGAECADILLVHFYRWVSYPHALLFDSVLHRQIHLLMRKVLFHLLAHLRTLGATVVYASFNRLIINTNKDSHEAAAAYFDYISQALRTVPLFALIHLQPTRSYRTLLFNDISNYGGVEALPGHSDLASLTDAQLGIHIRRITGDDSQPLGDEGDGEQPKPADGERQQEPAAPAAEAPPAPEPAPIPLPEGGDQTAIAEKPLPAPPSRSRPSEPRYELRLEAPPPVPAAPIISHWNFASALPEPLQRPLLMLISEFVYLPVGERNERFKAARERIREERRKQVEQALQEGRGEAEWKRIEAAEPPAARRPDDVAIVTNASREEQLRQDEALVRTYLMSHELQERLFSLVHTIIRNVNPGEKSTGVPFPATPPAGFERTAFSVNNPALAFIVTLCHLYGLDSAVEREVQILKKNLLKLVGILEFASEAQFVDPSRSFVIPDVVCTFCNMCRDLDLCRDPDLLAKNWACPQCSHPYDTEMIEDTLVEIAQQLSTSAQLQDLKCRKCGLVKNSYLADRCQCSGAFSTPGNAPILQSLGTLYRIARFYEMGVLRDCLSALMPGGAD
ncbi:putative DNA polymerase epsilon catalytic subunit A [Paratrimastix pyriformis]|uniref:DNA polymerase epsilon catalytic subunit n=1 Tax=Paratrimastix pyriformis TaxID=342808 RepID=A0ABQ8UL03_9EUKA|nr:putative DNA polymerase epsilon catalytic subunit A [Paratrimastix pyriformis]